jgi:hypothetical protein
MGSISSPDATYRKILVNPRNSQRLRLEALKAMLRPPLLLLMRLERDPDTPAKLKFAIVQRREIETLVRKARHGRELETVVRETEETTNDTMGPRRQAADTTGDCGR